jgi:hypothetical protein
LRNVIGFQQVYQILLQQLRDHQQRVIQLEQELGTRTANHDALAEEKIRLMREIAKLKAGKGGNLDVVDIGGVGGGVVAGKAAPVSASEAALKTVGNLRLYEITLGIFFIMLVINWTLFPN